MEAFWILLTIVVLGLFIWDYRRSGRRRKAPKVTSRTKPQPAADPDADEDYRLKPYRSNGGQGYTVVRNSDGQTLSWRTLPRSEGLEAVGVAGESFHEDDLQSDAFAPGRRLSLVREPDNPHSEDDSATAIMDASGELQAGYIPSEHAPRIARKLDGGEELTCYSMWEVRKQGKRVSLRVLLVAPDASLHVPA